MPVCAFINLDDAAERRRSVQASFAGARAQGWTLERFDAVRPDPADYPDPKRAGVVGCFQSHRALLADHLADEAPLFVAEDDVAFGPSTFAVVDALLAQRHDWDILFTDVMVADMALLTQLARERAEYEISPKGFHLHDLQTKAWGGSTAYVVRGTSKRKLHALLAEADLSRPYDLYLRDLCNQGRLKAVVSLPFLTSISEEAARSQIDGRALPDWEAGLHLFRRLMFLHRDLVELEREAGAIEGRLDLQSRIAGTVVGAVAGATFPRLPR